MKAKLVLLITLVAAGAPFAQANHSNGKPFTINKNYLCVPDSGQDDIQVRKDLVRQAEYVGTNGDFGKFEGCNKWAMHAKAVGDLTKIERMEIKVRNEGQDIYGRLWIWPTFGYGWCAETKVSCVISSPASED